MRGPSLGGLFLICAAGRARGAMLLCLIAVSALLVRLMISVGTLDHPVARSSHTVPTPKGGGVGIAAAYALGTLWLLYRYKVPGSVATPLCAALLLALVSYIDDVRPGPFYFKLAAQIAATAGVILAGDRLRDIALGGATIHLAALSGVPLTLAWFLFVTNAVNFMDGLNGLASGSICVTGVALAAASAPPLRAEATPLIAGILGFLPFNYPRARIFMGDVGSQLCGFVAADLAVRAAATPAVALITPLALLPLLADVAATLIRRLRAGERLTQAHRGHLYQMANRSGMQATKVAAIYWIMTAWGGSCGIAGGRTGTPLAVTLSYVALSIVPFVAWSFYVSALARRAGITRE